MKFSILVCRPIKGSWINFLGRGGGSPQIPIHYCMHPNAATWTGIFEGNCESWNTGTRNGNKMQSAPEIRCMVLAETRPAQWVTLHNI